MSETWPPKCPKCGGMPNVRWCAAGSGKYSLDCQGPYHEDREAFHFVCHTCSYNWLGESPRKVEIPPKESQSFDLPFAIEDLRKTLRKHEFGVHNEVGRRIDQLPKLRQATAEELAEITGTLSLWNCYLKTLKVFGFEVVKVGEE